MIQVKYENQILHSANTDDVYVVIQDIIAGVRCTKTAPRKEIVIVDNDIEVGRLLTMLFPNNFYYVFQGRNVEKYYNKWGRVMSLGEFKKALLKEIKNNNLE